MILRFTIRSFLLFLTTAVISTWIVLNIPRVESQQFQDIITGETTTSEYYRHGFPFKYDLPDQFPDEPMTVTDADGSTVYLKPILQTKIIWRAVVGNVIVAVVFSFAFTFIVERMLKRDPKIKSAV